MTDNNQRVNEQAKREAFDKIAQADGLDIERGFKDGYRDADTRAAFRGFKLALQAIEQHASSAPAAPAVTDAARDVLAEIDTILKGIDQQEAQSENGWWETSAGAEFGMKKLREVRAAINAAMRTQSKE